VKRSHNPVPHNTIKAAILNNSGLVIKDVSVSGCPLKTRSLCGSNRSRSAAELSPVGERPSFLASRRFAKGQPNTFLTTFPVQYEANQPKVYKNTRQVQQLHCITNTVKSCVKNGHTELALIGTYKGKTVSAKRKYGK